MSAASLLRETRTSAGLSQSAIAARANMPQSTVSAYESGRREPGFAAFERLIEAAGARVRVGDGRLLDRVRQEAPRLRETLAPFGVRRIRVFGSVARGDEEPQSDIDLLVDLERTPSLVTLVRMRQAAAAVLGREVDVVPENALRESIRDEVLGEALPL